MKMSLSRTVILAGVAGLSMASVSQGAISLGVSLTASENFDGLPSASGGTSPTAGAFGVGATAVVDPIDGTTFDAARLSGTQANAATTALPFFVNDGTGNSGGIHSYGTGTDTDRALGLLASGSNVPAAGVVITNNSGSSLESISVTFTQEAWRSSTTSVNTLNAQYALSGGAVTSSNYLTVVDPAFVDIDALDLVGPPAVATNGPLNGNDPLNQAARSAIISFSPKLADGASVFLRFQDFNDVGNDAGLALDNFTVTGVIPEPATLGALLAAGALLVARRR